MVVACSGNGSSTSSESVKPSDYLYYDDFSPGNSGQWMLEGDELGHTEIVADQLHILVQAPNTAQYASLKEPMFSDFILEVDASLVQGAADSTYGVLTRIQEGEGFYRFEIMADGRYMVERFDGEGTWNRLIDDWKFSEAIMIGTTASNRIRLEVAGTDLAFYVNDTLLEKVSDPTYSTGLIGFDAGTYGSPLTDVTFDNLKISQP